MRNIKPLDTTKLHRDLDELLRLLQAARDDVQNTILAIDERPRLDTYRPGWPLWSAER